MKIYVDADACPRQIKEILYKAAMRTGNSLLLVANKALSVPKHPLIISHQVAHGFDVADDYIVKHAEKLDLVITADIPLAAQLIDNGVYVLNPRGEMYTPDTIAQRLTMRNFMDELRGSGVQTSGPKPLGAKEIQQFANALDRLLAKY